MKILVTGSGGFLGSRIVQRLLVHGQTDIRAMLRTMSKGDALSKAAEVFPDAHVELFPANLKNPADIRAAVENVKVIIHAAAALKGSPAEMFLDSVVASRNLLDAVAALPETDRPRIVLISSFGAMGVPKLPRGALVDENVPLEEFPGERDVYSHTKLRQEQLFREYRDKFKLDLVVLRPGVIYGPGTGHFSNRVGLQMFGRFLHLGGKNLLPLTFVENCAEAIVVAALAPEASGEVYNIVDDELVTSREYLARYRRDVRPIRSVRIPYFVLNWISSFIKGYYPRSRAQLPAIFTPYKVRAMWGGNQFSNQKLHSLGWKQLVSTQEGLRRTFAAFRAEGKSE